jgi:hypothetical protein
VEKALISHWDAILMIPFLLGYGLFILKMASNAVRSSLNHITNGWQYVTQNLDTFSIRLLFALPFFGLLQHANNVATYLNHPIPFEVPHGALACAMLGYLSNSLIDWASSLDRVPIVGWPIPQFIKDNIPVIPIAQGKLPLGGTNDGPGNQKG